MEKKEREELKERLLKMVVNEPRLESMPPMTMAEVMVNSMSKPNLEPLLDFISQELDRAREEGYQKGWEDGGKGRVFEKIEVETEVTFKDLRDVIEGKEDAGEFLSKLTTK